MVLPLLNRNPLGLRISHYPKAKRWDVLGIIRVFLVAAACGGVADSWECYQALRDFGVVLVVKSGLPTRPAFIAVDLMWL